MATDSRCADRPDKWRRCADLGFVGRCFVDGCKEFLYLSLDLFSEHPQRQCPRRQGGLLTAVAVCHHARKLGHLANPAAVFFLVDLEGQLHAVIVPTWCHGGHLSATTVLGKPGWGCVMIQVLPGGRTTAPEPTPEERAVRRSGLRVVLGEPEVAWRKARLLEIQDLRKSAAAMFVVLAHEEKQLNAELHWGTQGGRCPECGGNHGEFRVCERRNA
jgi:hypothetical protein